jgi:hypothetical protein
MREAENDGRKAIQTLTDHYAGKGTPRLITLYTELTSLKKSPTESVTDYVMRAETSAVALRNAKETVSDQLLIAMVLKGLPDSFQSFVAVVTQNDKKQTFTDFKIALRSFEETEKSRAASGNTDDSVLKMNYSRREGTAGYQKSKADAGCYRCGMKGHISRQCRNDVWCSICKRDNHNTQCCRMNQRTKDTSAKMVNTETEEFSSYVENTFAFKIDTSKDTVPKDMLLVDCGATSHLLNDESMFVTEDKDFDPEKHFIELADGSKKSGLATKRGVAEVWVMNKGGQNVKIELHNALCVPSFPQNIFSVQAATNKGATVSFAGNKGEVEYAGMQFAVHKYGKLFYLHTQPRQGDSDQAKYAKSIDEWHQILGHCNYEDIKCLEGVVAGMKIKGTKQPDCEVCIKGKMTDGRNRDPRVRANKPLELVHTDLAGPITPASKEGFKYACSFTDDYTGTVFVYFMKTKDETVKVTERFLADSAPYGSVRTLRSDNGTEYTSEVFQELLRKNKIKHETSAPYSPHQNGTAERHWRTLFEMGRCMLLQAGLSKALWPYAVHAAAYTRNRCYNKRIQMTPYEAMTGKRPDVSNMQVFGTACYTYIQGLKQKLDTRGKKGIFVGYDRASPAYLVYFPDTGKVGRCRRVTFLTFRDEDEKTQNEAEFDVCDFSPRVDEIESEDEHRNNDEPKASESEVNEPTRNQPADKVRRYPERERRAPSYLRDFDQGDGEEEEDGAKLSTDYCYAIFPKSFKEAMKTPEAPFWEEAMKDEMSSLEENGTFTLTSLPEGKETVGGRWVFAVKEGSDGSQSYKARFVAKGYSQTKGTDYHETFAPTANMSSIRTVAQIAAQNDLILHQMDVKTAYLNADIDCEIYMEQPEGFEQKGGNDETFVWKLNKSLYGLKQSGRNWNKMLDKHFSDNGFVQSPSDHCVYTKTKNDDMTVVLVWVDDIIIGAKTDEKIKETKLMLQSKFKMKDLGRLSYFLGIEFQQGPDFVKMNQRKYIQKILEKFEMTECKPRTTPSEQKWDDERKEPVDPRKYRELVGSLIYLMICTRPDICWVVTKLSQHLSAPVESHWIAAKHVLRYLKGTIDHELCYRKNESGLILSGYSDADWAASEDDRRSTSGYCFSLNPKGPFISWKSRKQPTVALSSCEAEYIALAGAVQESLYLDQLLNNIGCTVQEGPTVIFEDNQGAIALAGNPVNRQRSKHIDIKYHFIRSEVNNGRVTLRYCPTANMVADIFTKPASKMKLGSFQSLIFGK